MSGSNHLTQELKQEQGLNLSPIQLLASRLVELTNLELAARIEHELEDNPALEEGSSEEKLKDETSEDSSNDEDQDWELGEYASEDDIPSYKLQELQERQSFREEIPFASFQPSLDSLLLEQLFMEGLRDEDEDLARYIIGNISADGYLTRDAQDLQDDLIFKLGIDVSLEKIEQLIAQIKTLDPAGIGAKDLQECLLLQIERLSTNEHDDWTKNAKLILTQYYNDFKAKNYEALCRHIGISREELSDLYAHIAHLNPKPGSSLGDEGSDKMMHYRPDFIIHEEDDGELSLSIVGEQEIRPLRLNRMYQEMLEDSLTESNLRKQKETHNFLKHKISQAQWFIEALSMRQNTLRKTMLAIMKRQDNFLRSGDVLDLKPMILKDIADDTGLDISTISRVSNSKSVQTDYGVYPVKYFFGDGMISSSGEEVSTRAIKQKLSELITQEDKQKPLTDEELASKLSDEGYSLARRTIAKYREALGIPIARLRRNI